MTDRLSDSVLRKISKQKPKGRVCFFPNFSLDFSLNTSRSFSSLVQKMREVHDNGGGDVTDDSIAEFSLGGCSAISAHCHAMLGGKSYFIGQMDSFGKTILTHFFKQSGAKMYVKQGSKLPFTLILEVGNSNLMFSDTLEYSSKDPRAFEIIKKSKILSMQGYWAVVKPQLAETFLRKARSNGVLTYIDTSDPINFKKQIPRFLSLFDKQLVNIFSVNDNEAIQYASFIDGRKFSNPVDAAGILSDRLKVEINLHTRNFSVIFRSDRENVRVPGFLLKRVQKLTGAGDNWVAGNLYAICLGLEPEERLLFANAVSGYYITERHSPNLKEVISFIKTHRMQNPTPKRD